MHFLTGVCAIIGGVFTGMYLQEIYMFTSRVETSTDFATRVPNIHYPMGTRVLVTVNLVSD